MNQTRPKAIASVFEVVDLLRYVDEPPQADDGVTHWLIHNFLLGPEGIIPKPVSSPEKPEDDSKFTVSLTAQEFQRALDRARYADDRWSWLDSQQWLLDHALSQDNEIQLRSQ